MPDAFAPLACSVELYPFEGAPLVIQGGQIQSVTVSKSLLGGALGQFSINLAPGGPAGPEDPVTWSQIITPMSHALIGMSRGADAAIVMTGVVTDTGEAQEWRTNEQGATVSRGQAINGADFAWFFRSFNFYALTFMGLTAGTPVGNALNMLPGSMTNYFSQGLVGGTSAADSNPVQVGRVWYQKIMAGSNGLLNKTFVPFVNGSRISFNDAVSAVWQNYPKVFIPLSDYFMTVQESWMEKFLAIFPHPWYEFFVTTAEAGDYSLPLNAKGFTDHGTLFNMQSMPYAPAAGPLLVARVNPTPKLTITGGNSPAPGELDAALWNQLPLTDFTQSSYGFLTSTVRFSAAEARNFYQINPSYYRTLLGTSNTNNIPAIFFFIAAADPASVQRYGFRPQIGTIRWMDDPTGAVAQNPGLNVQQTILNLTGALISWFHPAPLMARAQVTLPLAPSIRIGTRFRYAPYKNTAPWDFYIEAVQHRFVFGGTSSTTLSLSRGLPSAVYADATSDSVLRAVHLGQAMRNAGDYVVGLPPGTGESLQIVVTPDQAASLSQRLSTAFVTPQTQ